ncbi:hypothetical protein Poli38472_005665 [Pythium oligandrum]|uniref:C2 domain-containing protein n=1 Tax=Pythium oligandrum TaxID=41045 RepID=A0A8K1FKP6_PYTOL|nr:hypothetical protein Poli38472_005665 [Pythium oligandrum]|eukprot:TMW63047.1 hypothetical protein Poli38472_005665 [Pythium oligandrum]
MTSSSSYAQKFRIRLLEPSVGVVTGGTRVLIHGKGFRPLPHSLLVRFRLAETGARLEVPGKFVLETQLECVVPNFQEEVVKVISKHTTLAPTSATILLAPQIVPLEVEVIMDSERISNVLVFVLHQEIVIQKITPQILLMTPATTVTATLNLLKLSSQHSVFSSRDHRIGSVAGPLSDISTLPVFIRVRQVSERTSAVSERIVEAQWRVSPVGVYEIDFPAVMMTFGQATVELTMNRSDYFRGKDKTPEAMGYSVHRDVSLHSIDPCCVRVASGKSTEMRILGEGFVDSGDIVVQLLQKEISDTPQSTKSTLLSVAQLNATFTNANEIRCTVHANMSFGLTSFQVSLNGGRQYGKERVIALLHRDREVEAIMPSYSSLEGGTLVTIHYGCLTVEDVDSPHQIQHLVPPKRIRVKFHVLNLEGTFSDIFKIVNVEMPAKGSRDEHGVIRCRTPSFLEEMKAVQLKAAKEEGREGIDFSRVYRFHVSLALGGDNFFGSLDFGGHFPPVIRSVSQHHGPATGGTVVFVRMTHRVPNAPKIQVRFHSLSSSVSEVVEGVVGTEYERQRRGQGEPATSFGSPTRPQADSPSCTIVCFAPEWIKHKTELPHLTKIQISFDGGCNYYPTEEESMERVVRSPRTSSPTKARARVSLMKDLSYLYYLFYRPPRLTSVSPMSADIQGGSFVRIAGDNVVDHGGQITVVFHSPEMSRKVVGFVENSEIRCCAPPFLVGPVTVFVSFNGEQYTKCAFLDPDSRQPIDFVYYSSPSLSRLSPLCACITESSLISIFGINLIETGRIKVRFGFVSAHGKLVYKDVPGRAQDGIITARSPLFSADHGDTNAVVDVALNGNDFSGTTLRLYYYSTYQIRRVEPQVGGFEIPIPLSIQVSQPITSDSLLVRVRLATKHSGTKSEAVYGPVAVGNWDAARFQFILPAIANHVGTPLESLLSLFIDVSFDKAYFHPIGNLLQHYHVYNIPSVISISPLYGPFDQETVILAKCAQIKQDDVVKITMTLVKTGGAAKSRGIIRHQHVVIASMNAKRQQLTWTCPSLATILGADKSFVQLSKTSMLLPATIRLEVSTVDGQLRELPFLFQYYRAPVLLKMSPRVGYICGGSLISFEFKEAIETPTVDFQFGSQRTAGRVRDQRFVECCSPELPRGVYDVSVSFNEQHFEAAFVPDEERDEDAEDEPRTLSAANSPIRPASSRMKRAVFQAFAMPKFTIPDNPERVYGFGPTEGGSIVVLKGHGFIPEGKIFVKFCAHMQQSYADTSEIIVKAKVVDSGTIHCVTPPAWLPGRVLLQVTYNLQQYTDSSCFFEYHERTRFSSHGVLCGPVSGGTPVVVQVIDKRGLPENPVLVSPCVRFVSEKEVHQDVVAVFNSETLEITCVAPEWPSNELVKLHVSLSCDDVARYVNTGVSFLFYDPPQALIHLEPSAGPVTGGTEVLALCGKIVDTGEIMVSVTMRDDPRPAEAKAVLESVGEELEEDEADEDETSKTAGLSTATPIDLHEEVYVVRGKIVGEAVSFVAPSVGRPGVAFLNISLNGINYTSVQTTTLRFTYYLEPVLHRISPIWSAIETPTQLTLCGDNIHDFGCKPLFKLLPQETTGENHGDSDIIIEGSFEDRSLCGGDQFASSSAALQGLFQTLRPGWYEIEISLNGQQFSKSKFLNAKFGNYSGTACTTLPPFRCFASPFFLATPTGPVAGGSTVVLYMGKRLDKMFSRETKCQVQFALPKGTDQSGSGLSSASISSSMANKLTDVTTMTGEIDHKTSRVTCRAPLLRSACTAFVDLVLPLTPETKAASTSCVAFFGVKDREKYYAYESPTITEIAPNCGPTSGGTCLVIEGTNILDTGQIFVRFRSNLNERECVLIPGTYSRTFPDGSLSVVPLIICRTPPVEFVDRVISGESGSTSTPLSPPSSPTRNSRENASTARLRAQTFQQMAEQSLKVPSGTNALRVTRTVTKNTPRNAAEGVQNVNVLVDFTLNAGEQFIAHSVPFHFYSDVDPNDVKWSPRHLPSRTFDRIPTETRILTVQLPKTFRLNETPERISFHFDGTPQQIYSKRRGSSIVLHETGGAHELLIFDAPKLKTQSTMRRRSTYFRHSSISATSNNLLGSTGTSMASTNRQRPIPPKGGGPRSNQEGKRGSSSGGRDTASSPSSTYIAAKVIKSNELTCPVPEFSCAGTVKVFFSLNSQQFVYLGNLVVHDPLTIKEDEQHRFCSNVGGDRFVLYCSPSRAFDFLQGQDLTNEANLELASVNTGVVKTSSALAQANDVTGDSSEAISDPSVLTPQEVTALSSSAWRPRRFYAVQLHLAPPSPRVMKKVVLTASQVGSKAEISACSPDENGCCVFETTDWMQDMVVSTSSSSTPGYSLYSALLSRSKFHPTESESNPASMMHALLVQLPTGNEVRVVMLSRADLVLTLVDRHGATLASGSRDLTEGNDVQSLLIDSTKLDASLRECFVCVSTSTHTAIAGTQNVQVAIVDASGVLVYLLGMTQALGDTRWIVARVERQCSESGHFAVHTIDKLVSDATESRIEGILASTPVVSLTQMLPLTQRRLETIPSAMVITAKIQFACADSSRNLSVAAIARVILPDAYHSVSSLLSAEQVPRDLRVECEMPALVFNGPTVLSILVDGVTFSNSICVHCYDPRLWRITSLDPPCGLVNETVDLRVIGEQFVENKRVVVRFVDSHRYLNMVGTTDRFHLLIVRVASLRNVRTLLPPHIVNSITSSSSSSPQKNQQREDDTRGAGSSSAPGVSPFSVIVKVECLGRVFTASCRDSVVLAALTSSTPLSWEDQFEVPVFGDLSTVALVVIVEVVEGSTGSSRIAVEVGRAIVPLRSVREGSLTQRVASIEEHFRRSALSISPATHPASSEMNVFLHLSPLMKRPEVVQCQVGPFRKPQVLGVQISSGDSFFSPCPELPMTTVMDEKQQTVVNGVYRPLFRVYEMPETIQTTPNVLPRSTGGDIVIHGHGFFSCDDGRQHNICVRIFACAALMLSAKEEEALLQQINSLTSIQAKTAQFFVRDLAATFISPTMLQCAIPPHLATYSFFYRVSMDGRAFTPASPQTRVQLYSADSLEPKGGPVSGNTYVAVHGTNINACMSHGGTPLVRLTWMRGTRELESIVVSGEFYPPEEVVYFYTPQSKFGLQNITVHIELGLGPPVIDGTSTVTLTTSSVANRAPNSARFSQDQIPFVIYRTPSIKTVAPLAGLVCGVSVVEMIVQGLDEKATMNLKTSYKMRFKRRGQMQLSDVHSLGEGKMTAVVPRFNVSAAVGTDVPVSAHVSMTGPSPCRSTSPARQSQGVSQPHGPLRIWNRLGALFVVVLRAKNLHVTKKSTCNPFVVVSCNKLHLRSTRKDGTFAPVWNELFDFDWRGETTDGNSDTPVSTTVRLVVENQLSADQSEGLGCVEVRLAPDLRQLSKPFCTRAWFPLRKLNSMSSQGSKPSETTGDLEIAISFIPAAPKKKLVTKLFHAATLRYSLRSAVQIQKQKQLESLTQEEKVRQKKEKALRVFRQPGTTSTVSVVPNEVHVELALNGQDFWSVAPTRCHVAPAPILLQTSPSWICLSGGTPLSITGINFASTGCIRVAFVVVDGSAKAPTLIGTPVNGSNVAIVDARYRSSTLITCLTPSLSAISSVDSVVCIYVALNGLDFDSVSLPVQTVTAPISEDTYAVEATASARKLLMLANGRYVLDPSDSTTAQVQVPTRVPAASPLTALLRHQVQLYLRPVIKRIRPADGVYTSRVVLEGRDFSDTGVAIARFCSTSNETDVRAVPVDIISSERMECNVPDFPGGTIVRTSIAVNGVEFVDVPDTFEIFQSPRLVQIVPRWISLAWQQPLILRGINLTTVNASSSPSRAASGNAGVQVSFTCGGIKRTGVGKCVNGEVHCDIPTDLLTRMKREAERVRGDATNDPSQAVAVLILVDVWLGGTHMTYTGRPQELRVYRQVPSITAVAPMNGAIYGGYTITIDGRGFLKTNDIVLRFTRVLDGSEKADENTKPSGGDETSSESQPEPTPEQPTMVNVGARFVSEDRLTCTVPPFAQEGVYMLSVALNGVEFSPTNASSWFLIWQNWQRRKLLLAQFVTRSPIEALAQEVNEEDEADTINQAQTVPSPLIPTSPRLSQPAPTDLSRLGARSTVRLTPPLASAESSLSSALLKMVEDEERERVEDHFVDPRLLRWHPATTEEKGRTLIDLLTDLLNVSETQQIILRRIGFLFRTRGVRDVSTQRLMLGQQPFISGMKLIFPHAPDREFDELWRVVDPLNSGRVTLWMLVQLLVVTSFGVGEADRQSPEPGPTHYNPSYTITEARPTAAIILPPTDETEQLAGLPSELFMNYEAFKAVRPRVIGGTFPKRSFKASWCNPVPKELSERVIETDEEVERAFDQHRRAVSPSSASSSLRKANKPSGRPRPPSQNNSKWKPTFALPLSEEVSQALSPTSREGNRYGQQVNGVEREQDDTFDQQLPVSRAERSTATTSKVTSLRSPRETGPAGIRPRTRSLLHEDIAPLYLKFLKSKEVQKATKQ